MAQSQKSTNKRPGSSQGGPKSKKRHVDSTSQPKVLKRTIAPKRSRPITQVVEEEAEDGSEDEIPTEMSEDEKDEATEVENQEMDVDEQITAKDPNGMY